MIKLLLCFTIREKLEGEKMPCEQSCDQDTSFISLIPIFQGLKSEEVQTLQKVINKLVFRKGDFIFREGDPSETLYIIYKGLIKITKVSEEGKEQIVRLLFPGDFFGQSALLQTENHYANAEAIDSTEVYTINKGDFLKTLERNPDMSFRYILALNERLHQADEWMSILSLMEVERRLASVLLLFSDKAKSGNFKLPISKKLLASLIGTTPETISRKLVTLVAGKIISMKGQRDVQILDLDALKRLAKP